MFTTFSGTTGPAVSTNGTDYFDLTFGVDNSNASAANVVCGVNGTNIREVAPIFTGSYQLPSDSAGTFTLSGIAPVQAGTSYSLACSNSNTGANMTILGAQWYVAPVQTTS